MIGGEEKERERGNAREWERESERDYEVSKMSFDVNIIYGLYTEYQMKQKIWLLKYRNIMWLFYQRWTSIKTNLENSIRWMNNCLGFYCPSWRT